MRFLFPKTRFVDTVNERVQAHKIFDEALELDYAHLHLESDERKASEALDVMQAAETYLRQLEGRKGPGWLEDQFQAHIKKLTTRGSYNCEVLNR